MRFIKPALPNRNVVLAVTVGIEYTYMLRSVLEASIIESLLSELSLFVSPNFDIYSYKWIFRLSKSHTRTHTHILIIEIFKLE